MSVPLLIAKQVQRTFKQCTSMEKKLQKIFKKGVRQGILDVELASVQVGSMTGPHTVVNNIRFLQAPSSDTRMLYTQQDAQRFYADAFQRRTAMQQRIVQRIARKIQKGEHIEWDYQAYKILSWAAKFYPLDTTTFDYSLSHWDWLDDEIAKVAVSRNVEYYADDGLYESVSLVAYSQLGEYLKNASYTIEELLENTPVEWLLSLFWDSTWQEGILGLTASHVDQDAIAGQYLSKV